MGITGGIAAYKAADLTSKLIRLGAKVKVIMTPSATKFVHPLTFQSLTENRVYLDVFGATETYEIGHISLAKWADLFVIAPATANIIGKAAAGIADDLLSTTMLSMEAKTVFAPAMNTVMYGKPVLQDNIKKLKEWGFGFIPPGKGRLACGDWGEGKLADVGIIIQHIEYHLSSKKDMEGLKVLVTAGPTHEAIDPVRYITNPSSGKMGYSIAASCIMRGAEVDLVTGPTNLEPPINARVYKTDSAIDMYNTVLKIFDRVDMVFMTAAVADYRVKETASKKIKKTDDSLILELVRNPDILRELGKRKRRQVLIGFAAETHDLENHAIGKLESKNLDFILGNDVSSDESGFGSDLNRGVLFIRGEGSVPIPMMNKKEFAHRIIDEVMKRIR